MTVMCAVIDKENVVVGVSIEDSIEVAKNLYPDFFLVEMNLENSPASIGSYYDGQKFIMPSDDSL